MYVQPFAAKKSKSRYRSGCAGSALVEADGSVKSHSAVERRQHGWSVSPDLHRVSATVHDSEQPVFDHAHAQANRGPASDPAIDRQLHAANSKFVMPSDLQNSSKVLLAGSLRRECVIVAPDSMMISAIGEQGSRQCPGRFWSVQLLADNIGKFLERVACPRIGEFGPTPSRCRSSNRSRPIVLSTFATMAT